MKNLRLGITFAGGGTKSFYQLGLMSRWRKLLLPKVGLLAACSAGAFSAALLLSEREESVEQYWLEKYAGKVKNFDWRRLIAGQKPTPHESVYRDLLMHAFADGGFERIRSQPFPILILTTAFPAGMPSLIAMPLGLLAYNLLSINRTKRFHAPYNRLVGIEPLIFDARECSSPLELADLIIASSATPPFTATGKSGKRCLLDGGIINHVPAYLSDNAPEITHHLVLLTSKNNKEYEPRKGKWLFLAPSKQVKINTWDFSKPDLIKALTLQGESDADFYYPRLMEFLSSE
jgi:predicted acylesterase/phospholipase RssA